MRRALSAFLGLSLCAAVVTGAQAQSDPAFQDGNNQYTGSNAFAGPFEVESSTTSPIPYLFIDPTTGNVGIRTASPSASAVLTSSGTLLAVSTSSVGCSPVFLVNNQSNFTIFSVNQNGHVGIGTTMPDAMLQLAGGNLDMTNGFILNLATPTNDDGAANKWYVDMATGAISSGLLTFIPYSRIETVLSR